MTSAFDPSAFLEEIKACKPPYKCRACDKVYKTYSGIQGHVTSAHAQNDLDPSEVAAGQRSPSPAPFFRSPVKESLVFNEANKRIEFEAEGRLHKFSVYETLPLVSRDEWEASLPTSALAPEVKVASDKCEDDFAEAVTKTPKSGKKKKKLKPGTTPTKPRPKPKADSSADPNSASNSTEVGGGDKKLLKLPEAIFRELDDYDIGPAPTRSKSYYRFVEKSADELDEEVEYDMDEEDVAWMEMVNEKRSKEGLTKVHEDQFELLMDRLEKESYFHVQTNGKDYSAPIDDDAICCVCMDGECSNTNVILFCDLCNLAVHQECYGVPYIPEGQWLCRRCLQSPSRSVECCLCPNKGGAFKQTDDGRWAHVVCGLWIPEVRFANTVFLEPIDSIDNIPPARWKLSCRVCKQRGVGACIQCHKTNCYTAFHVTCGLLAGLHMKMDTVRETSASGLSVTVRKTAFCDVHTPNDSDCKPKLEDVAALGISTPKTKGKAPGKKPEAGSPIPVLFRGLMNFSPQCPWDKVQEIANLITVQRKNQFFQRLMAYWTLKRQTRNGVPLIRRLQFAKAMRPDRKPETPQKNAHHSQKKKEADKAAVKKAQDEFKGMLEQRKSLRRLRQDLERVRLLCELIRKREQRKRELVNVQCEIVVMRIMPFICFVRKMLETMQSVDAQEIFAEPVDASEVPDYYDHIKTPMDFKTMHEKLDNFEYLDLDSVEADFTLMVDNCLSYNERETIFFRAGVKMRDHGGSLLRQARRDVERIGFEGDTGTHSAEQPAVKPSEDVSDEKLMKEIDTFLYEEDDELSPEEHLKRLLELKDKASLLHHPVAKVKRIKTLKQEITKTRRKLSMDKAGTSPGFKKVEKNVVAKKGKKAAAAKMEEDEEETETEKEKEVEKKTPAGGAKRGKKRTKSVSEETEAMQPPAKKKPAETPTKGKNQPASSPTKSPGVNRRNAVLFNKKKTGEDAKEADEAKPKRKEPKIALGNDTNDEEDLENVEMQSPAPSGGGVTITSPAGSPAKSSASPSKAKAAASPKSEKKRGRKKKTKLRGGPSFTPEKSEDDESQPDSWKPRPAAFNEYRRGGAGLDGTDDDTQSESATDTHGTSEGDSADESDSDADESVDGDADSSASRIPLEPLDLVWAKCTGYPWYPALIINPKMPRTGYLHNGVPIPVPPQDVLDMAESHASPHFLILFFDAKRTWQWLQRDKLEPLGVESETDKAKLVQSKKPGERKAVKKAYEDAILHRCRVTGENASVTEEEESSGTEAEDAEDASGGKDKK